MEERKSKIIIPEISPFTEEENQNKNTTINVDLNCSIHIKKVAKELVDFYTKKIKILSDKDKINFKINCNHSDDVLLVVAEGITESDICQQWFEQIKSTTPTIPGNNYEEYKNIWSKITEKTNSLNVRD